MGKWPFEILAELFLKNEKASDDRSTGVFSSWYAAKLLGKKEITKKAPRGAKNKFIN